MVSRLSNPWPTGRQLLRVLVPNENVGRQYDRPALRDVNERRQLQGAYCRDPVVDSRWRDLRDQFRGDFEGGGL